MSPEADGTCRSCQAPMIWARTQAGRNIPLDPTPSPKGNVELTADNFAVVLGGRAADERRVDTDLYISHFATCPNASRHRR